MCDTGLPLATIRAGLSRRRGRLVCGVRRHCDRVERVETFEPQRGAHLLEQHPGLGEQRLGFVGTSTSGQPGAVVEEKWRQE
jgi:hypothetical protein